GSRRKVSEPYSVGVAVPVVALVRVAGDGLVDRLAEDDDAGRAAVDAQGTPGADVLVDDEEHMVAGVVARLLGTHRLLDGVDREHVDALPGTDVDAALAEDALRLVDVEELLRLHRRREPGRVDLLQLVGGGELGHRRVGVSLSHDGCRFSPSWSLDGRRPTSPPVRAWRRPERPSAWRYPASAT